TAMHSTVTGITASGQAELDRLFINRPLAEIRLVKLAARKPTLGGKIGFTTAAVILFFVDWSAVQRLCTPALQQLTYRLALMPHGDSSPHPKPYRAAR
ncbi:MAG: hypothetical protein ACYC4S_18765, partial [Rhodoferax sp.]